MQNILVTGAAGFIGHKTAEMLLESGKSVTCIDSINDYYDVRLKRYRLDSLKNHSGFTFHQADIRDLDKIEAVFRENSFDAVINLAAMAGVRYSMEKPSLYMTTNADGTLNILELMRKYKIRKLVLASTSSLYAGQKMPFVEDLPVNTPISPYAASKKAAELIAYTYSYHFGIDVSVVRYFTVYGPCGRPDMSPFRFIKWIDEGREIELFGDGSQSRDFTFVDDIARGTISALTDVGYEIINLGGGKNPISMLTVIEKMEKYLGKKARIKQKPFQKADMMETWADISKAGKLLGWKPEISFDEGLRRTVDWHVRNRDWIKTITV
jgi:UDP-glucuronate 4-epimerase